MKPTFDHTVNVLVQAYLNDELAHATCSACAVGNIVAHAWGTKPKPLQDGPMEFDNNQFENGMPAMSGWYSELYWGLNSLPSQIDKTGYTKHELIKIEKAFEGAPGRPPDDFMYRGKSIDPTWMFNGLMAVVDVLAEIHGVDLSVRESAKLQFVKP